MKASKKEICDKLLLAAHGDEDLLNLVDMITRDLNNSSCIVLDPLPVGYFTLTASLMIGCTYVNYVVVKRLSAFTEEDIRVILECSKDFCKGLCNKLLQIFVETFPQETDEFEYLNKMSRIV
ncbi:MAG: hypothetical protein WCW31_04560 [Patescibacteria group bacterium]|jgi:hypothetical protein